MSLKPIEPKHFAQDDVEPGTGARIANDATSMNRYGSQRKGGNPGATGTIPPDLTGGMNTYAAHGHAAPKPARSKKTLVAVAVAVAVVAIAAVCAVVAALSCSRQVAEEEAASATATVTIPSGYGSGDIAQLLREAGAISSTTEFIQTVSQQGAESSLKAGTYTFAAGTTYAQIVEALVAGPESSGLTLTIPEGLTVAQVAERVSEVFPDISAESFLEAAKASRFVEKYTFLAGAYDDSLEGFLFPKTYTFAEGVDADAIIRAMLGQFQTETAGVDWSAAAQGAVSLSEYEVVVAASLVERETAVASERPTVASVIYNRLNAGWYLQIDAAVAYALGKSDLLSTPDTQVDSPYNTYLNLGLPPGPICSPSLESIQAVVAADATDYYFYVASPALDGTHVFCVDEASFEEAFAAYNAVVYPTETGE
jgi:UPF0755 protein